MNNNDRRIISPFVLRLITILIVFVSTTKGALYPYGPENGDSAITFPMWELGSESIDLDVSVPLLGDGVLSSVWVNTLGALTYNQLMDPRFENLVNNIALSPFFSQSKEGANGAVYYRQTKTDQTLLNQIKEDISASVILPPSDNDVDTLGFTPTWALQVTWDRVASVQDQTLQNTYQIILTTDGKQSFAIYNYDESLAWNSAHGKYAAAGIFITPDAQSACSYALPNSRTEDVSALATILGNSGELGRFVLIISDPIRCLSRFESECGDILPSSDWGFAEPHFSITGSSWDIYALHTCNEGLHITPDVSSERIDCNYDPDYYGSDWSSDPSKCIDFNSTRNFDTEIGILMVGNDTALWVPELLEPESLEFKEMAAVVKPAITNILKEMGVNDVTVTITNFTQTPGPLQRSETTISITAGVRVHVPTFIHKKLTSESLETLITTSLNKSSENTGVKFVPEVTVTDETDRCLQGCLCRFRKDPALCRGGRSHVQMHSCCGGCNGIPYSQTIKACCNGQHLYDPTKASCCNGKIRQTTDNRCPKN